MGVRGTITTMITTSAFYFSNILKLLKPSTKNKESHSILFNVFREETGKGRFLSGRQEMEEETTIIVTAMDTPTQYGLCQSAVPLKTDWSPGTLKLAVQLLLQHIVPVVLERSRYVVKDSLSYTRNIN
jgi:hypothetical protein